MAVLPGACAVITKRIPARCGIGTARGVGYHGNVTVCCVGIASGV